MKKSLEEFLAHTFLAASGALLTVSFALTVVWVIDLIVRLISRS